MSTPLRRVARGPGAFDQGASGLGRASRGEASRTPALATGRCRRGEAASTHEVSGMVNTGEVTAFGHEGHGAGARHPTQGLEGVDHGAQAPGLSLIVECLRKPLEAFGGLVDGSDVFWDDELRRWCGTDDRSAPSQVGRAPGGPAWRAASVSPSKGVETAGGGLELASGILAGTTAGTTGVGLDRRDIDRGELARASQAGPLDGVTTVGLDSIASLVGHQGRGDDPAAVPSGGEITREPRPAGAGLVDEDQRLGLGLARADEGVEVAWPGADRPHRGDVSIPRFRSVGHGDGVVVTIQPDRQCASVRHG